MALELTFIINDESVNRYGYRILSAGIQTENFLKNPVCLVQHKNEYLSVGKWKGFKQESVKLSAVLEFDEGDEDAVKIYNKYKNGYMSAVSLSMLEITESEDPKYLLAGQKYATILECELLEISLVTVPGNANSLKLLAPDGKEKKLSLLTINNNDHKNQIKMVTKTPEELQTENDGLKKTLAVNLVKQHLDRGAITVDNKDFFEKNAVLDYEGTEKALTKLPSKNEENGGAKQLAAQLVEMHQKRGAITAQELDFYKKAAEADYDGTKKVLELKKGNEGLDGFVKDLSGASRSQSDPDDRSKWNFLDWYKKDIDGLQKLEIEKPEDHRKLLAAYQLEMRKSGTYIPSEG